MISLKADIFHIPSNRSLFASYASITRCIIFLLVFTSFLLSGVEARYHLLNDSFTTPLILDTAATHDSRDLPQTQPSTAAIEEEEEESDVSTSMSTLSRPEADYDNEKMPQLDDMEVEDLLELNYYLNKLHIHPQDHHLVDTVKQSMATTRFRIRPHHDDNDYDMFSFHRRIELVLSPKEMFLKECKNSMLSPEIMGDNTLDKDELSGFFTDYCTQHECVEQPPFKFNELPVFVQVEFIWLICPPTMTSAQNKRCRKNIDRQGTNVGYSADPSTMDQVFEDFCLTLWLRAGGLHGGTIAPTVSPTLNPTRTPSHRPSTLPSGSPSINPTTTPSVTPTTIPSVSPSSTPHKKTPFPAIADVDVADVAGIEEELTSRGLGDGGLAGILVGSAVVVAGTIVVFGVTIEKRRKSRRNNSDGDDDDSSAVSFDTTPSPLGSGSSMGPPGRRRLHSSGSSLSSNSSKRNNLHNNTNKLDEFLVAGNWDAARQTSEMIVDPNNSLDDLASTVSASPSPLVARIRTFINSLGFGEENQNSVAAQEKFDEFDEELNKQGLMNMDDSLGSANPSRRNSSVSSVSQQHLDQQLAEESQPKKKRRFRDLLKKSKIQKTNNLKRVDSNLSYWSDSAHSNPYDTTTTIPQNGNNSPSSPLALPPMEPFTMDNHEQNRRSSVDKKFDDDDIDEFTNALENKNWDDIMGFVDNNPDISSGSSSMLSSSSTLNEDDDTNPSKEWSSGTGGGSSWEDGQSQSSSINDDRIAYLERLIEGDDWQGIVTAVQKFQDSTTVGSKTRESLLSQNSNSRANLTNDDAQSQAQESVTVSTVTSCEYHDAISAASQSAADSAVHSFSAKNFLSNNADNQSISNGKNLNIYQEQKLRQEHNDFIRDRLVQTVVKQDWNTLERQASSLITNEESLRSSTKSLMDEDMFSSLIKLIDDNDDYTESTLPNNPLQGNSARARSDSVGYDGSVAGMTTGTGGEESVSDERIAYLEKLIESDDWQGIVTAVKTFQDDTTFAQSSLGKSTLDTDPKGSAGDSFVKEDDGEEEYYSADSKSIGRSTVSSLGGDSIQKSGGKKKSWKK
eukprot:CAMPEP_0184866506 /NCGR_PEP_ID=MMETSP0580-20130426/22669_1 /TAXON_ID=1118495 /ORGANISM="Dactyliosolen fragilissimus" /LENGTH=1072 /DNA_ID=CAMNT_0027366229 /DNA_START=149 /DNA_END=3367 /DNA_ORIENTATION=-